MKIAVVGGGRVGLPTAAGLASMGHHVVCCERDDAKRQVAAGGRAPFADAGLDDILAEMTASGRLRFCAGVAEAAANADAVMVAVPVPSGARGTETLDAVAAEFAAARPPASDCVFIIKSTVPPGACARIKKRLGIEVVSNPEFLREGFGAQDCINPSRVIVGCDDDKTRGVMRRIYAPLIARGVAYLEMNSVSAEITKLTANMFLSSRIALLNETADLCAAAGGRVADVIRALALDGRIGGDYLRASVGFGGGCLPKDGRLLLEAAGRARAAMPTVAAIYDSNSARMRRLADSIADAVLKTAVGAPLVAVLGVAFKPGSDSICESPSVAVMRRLAERGLAVRGHDANIGAGVVESEVAGVTMVSDAQAAADGADALVVMNADDAYDGISAAAVAARMRGRIIFDYAGVFGDDDAPAALNIYRIGEAW